MSLRRCCLLCAITSVKRPQFLPDSRYRYSSSSFLTSTSLTHASTPVQTIISVYKERIFLCLIMSAIVQIQRLFSAESVALYALFYVIPHMFLVCSSGDRKGVKTDFVLIYYTVPTSKREAGNWPHSEGRWGAKLDGRAEKWRQRMTEVEELLLVDHRLLSEPFLIFHYSFYWPWKIVGSFFHYYPCSVSSLVLDSYHKLFF